MIAILLILLLQCAAAQSSKYTAAPVIRKVNIYRGRHGAKNISINADISKVAYEWAKELATNRNGSLIHSTNAYGENLASIYLKKNEIKKNGGIDPAVVTQKILSAIDIWYNEVKLYNFSNPGFSMETGHFTALVWKNTEEFGVGVYKYKSWLIVCMNFYRAGNTIGKYKQNVFPAT